MALNRFNTKFNMMENKKKLLLDAIQSKDKAQLQAALQNLKPEKVFSYEAFVDGKYRYNGKDITKEDLNKEIEKLEMEFQVRVIQYTYTVPINYEDNNQTLIL